MAKKRRIQKLFLSYLLKLLLVFCLFHASFISSFENQENLREKIIEKYRSNKSQTCTEFVDLARENPKKAAYLLNLLLKNRESYVIAGHLSQHLNDNNQEIFITLISANEQNGQKAELALAQSMQIYTKRKDASGGLLLLETQEQYKRNDFKKIAENHDSKEALSSQDLIEYIEGISLTKDREEKIALAAQVITEELKRCSFARNTNKNELGLFTKQLYRATLLLDDFSNTLNYDSANLLYKILNLDKSLGLQIIKQLPDFSISQNKTREMISNLRNILGADSYFRNVYDELSSDVQNFIEDESQQFVSSGISKVEISKIRSKLDSFFGSIPALNKSKYSHISLRLEQILNKLEFENLDKGSVKDLLAEASKWILGLEIASLANQRQYNSSYFNSLSESREFTAETEEALGYLKERMSGCFNILDKAEALFFDDEIEMATAIFQFGVSALSLVQQSIEIEELLDRARKHKNKTPNTSQTFERLTKARDSIQEAFFSLILANEDSEIAKAEALLKKAEGLYESSVEKIHSTIAGTIQDVGWREIEIYESLKQGTYETAKFVVTTGMMVALFSVAGTIGSIAGTVAASAIIPISTTAAGITNIIVALGVESLIFLIGHKSIEALTIFTEDLLAGRGLAHSPLEVIPQSTEAFAWEYASTVVSLGVLKAFNHAGRLAMQKGLLTNNAIGHGATILFEMSGMGMGGVAVQTMMFAIGDEPVVLMRNGKPIQAMALSDILSTDNIYSSIKGSFGTVISFRIGSFLARPLIQRITLPFHLAMAHERLRNLDAQMDRQRKKLEKITDTRERLALEAIINANEKVTLENIILELIKGGEANNEALKIAREAYARCVAFEMLITKGNLATEPVRLSISEAGEVFLKLGNFKFKINAAVNGEYYVLDHLVPPVAIHKDALVEMANISKEGIIKESEIPYLQLGRMVDGNLIIDQTIKPDTASGKVISVGDGTKTNLLYDAISAYQQNSALRNDAVLMIREYFGEGTDTNLILEAEALSGPDSAYILPRFHDRANIKKAEGQIIIEGHNHRVTDAKPSPADFKARGLGETAIVSLWNFSVGTLSFKPFGGLATEPSGAYRGGVSIEARDQFIKDSLVNLNSGRSIQIVGDGPQERVAQIKKLSRGIYALVPCQAEVNIYSSSGKHHFIIKNGKVETYDKSGKLLYVQISGSFILETGYKIQMPDGSFVTFSRPELAIDDVVTIKGSSEKHVIVEVQETRQKAIVRPDVPGFDPTSHEAVYRHVPLAEIKRTYPYIEIEGAKRDSLWIGRNTVIGGIDFRHNYISVNHARIFFYEGQYSIYDQGSTNGTFIRSHGEYDFREVPRHPPTVLKPGDQLKLSRFGEIFEVPPDIYRGETNWERSDSVQKQPVVPKRQEDNGFLSIGELQGQADAFWEGYRSSKTVVHQIGIDAQLVMQTELNTFEGISLGDIVYVQRPTGGVVESGWEVIFISSTGKMTVRKLVAFNRNGNVVFRRAKKGERVEEISNLSVNQNLWISDVIEGAAGDGRTQLLAIHPAAAHARRRYKIESDQAGDVQIPIARARELFLVAPTQARVGNCYLIAAFNAMMADPNFLSTIAFSIKELPNGDFIVKIPLGSSSGHAVYVSRRDIQSQWNSNYLGPKRGHEFRRDLREALDPPSGSTGWKVLEAAYMKELIGEVDRARIEGGYGHRALELFFGNNFVNKIYIGSSRQALAESGYTRDDTLRFLNNFNNSRTIATVNTRSAPSGKRNHQGDQEDDSSIYFEVGGHELVYRHAYAIKKVDRHSQRVIVINPHRPEVEMEMSFTDFMLAFSDISAGEIKFENLLR
ncbi:MAG: FHA domain-containing protein [Pseudomonadota bacterium]